MKKRALAVGFVTSSELINQDFDSRLVNFLSAVETRSGEAIAAELCCSRTAVWKHIEALRAQGILIDAVAGQGYKLREPLELLNKSLIIEQLKKSSESKLRKLVILASTDSTNSFLQALPVAEQSGVAVLAECQSAGRGRRGQNWVSPFGRNIYASLGWEFDCGVGELACLPLLLALSACDALDRVGLKGHLIKWPNDILMKGRKLGGCLVEVQGDVSGPCRAVMGIGINVGMSESTPGADTIDQPWTDVSSHVEKVSRNQLAAFLLDSLLVRLGIFAADGFRPFQHEWKTRDALAGKEIELKLTGTTIKGIALGISTSGALVLQSQSGVGEYLAGEVSICRQGSVRE
ncbi:MAG: BirA family biotin operon repressor/biotin-[acetyl-CoA-carboxylase] ligase [Lysobacterales bacterium]